MGLPFIPSLSSRMHYEDLRDIEDFPMICDLLKIVEVSAILEDLQDPQCLDHLEVLQMVAIWKIRLQLMIFEILQTFLHAGTLLEAFLLANVFHPFCGYAL